MPTWKIIIKITQDLIGAKMTYLFNVIYSDVLSIYLYLSQIVYFHSILIYLRYLSQIVYFNSILI